MVCNKCGAQLPNDAVFCNNCGNNLAQQPYMQQQPQMQQQPYVQQQPQMQYQYQQPVMQPIIQPKAKLGIAVGLIAAGIFFMGIFDNLLLVLLAGYVIIKEEDSWLRKCAVRAIGTVVMFAVLWGLISLGFDFLRSIDTFVSWNKSVDALNKMLQMESIFRYIVFGFETIILFIMGIKALSMKAVKVPIVDGLISKHMN